MRYKDFPKHDMRRCLAVLLTLERLGARATLHYIAQALDGTRAEVARAIVVAQAQFGMVIPKTGPVYAIASWGILDRMRVAAMPGLAQEEDRLADIYAAENIVWDRETEAGLVGALVGAVATRRTPRSSREADVYRLSAQLLKTRYRSAADFLDSASRQFHHQARTTPRRFPDVVKEGLVSDVPRLRNLLDKRMEGVQSW